MTDLIYVGIVLTFFGLSYGLILFLKRLEGSS